MPNIGAHFVFKATICELLLLLHILGACHDTCVLKMSLLSLSIIFIAACSMSTSVTVVVGPPTDTRSWTSNVSPAYSVPSERMSSYTVGL